MFSVRPLVSVLLLMLPALAARAQAPFSAPLAPPPVQRRFESDFMAFAAADKAFPPVKGQILFVGSSIFRLWTTAPEQMAPLPVVNRAFGGSRTADQLEAFDELVLPRAPKVVVYYCGSNDIKAGKTPEDPTLIFSRFLDFSKRLHSTLPETRLIFVSSTRSPDRVARWAQVDHYNALARAYCEGTPGHTFVDINPVLVDAEGKPRLELYLDDRLHFKPQAYVEFSAVLKPVLQRVWNEAAASK